MFRPQKLMVMLNTGTKVEGPHLTIKSIRQLDGGYISNKQYKDKHLPDEC